MSRKNIIKYTLLENVPSSASFDTYQNPVNVDGMDNCSLFIFRELSEYALGKFRIWASNDKASGVDGRVPENWFELTFSEEMLISSNQGMIVEINPISFSWLAISYECQDPASTATITAKLTAKMIGG